MELDRLFSLPAHPLLVHVPVVLVPLAAVGVVLLAIRPAWIRPYGPIVVVIAALGSFGAVLAAGSGEALEESVEGVDRGSIADHAAAGETARNLAFVLFVLVAALVAIDWYGRRRAAAVATPAVGSVPDPAMASGPAPAQPPAVPAGGVPRWVSPVVAALAVAAAVASVVTIVDAGHSGAKAVWQGTTVSGGGNGGERGEHGERADD